MWLLGLGELYWMHHLELYRVYVHQFVCIHKSKPLHFVKGIFGLSTSYTGVLDWNCYIRGMECTQPFLQYQCTTLKK